MPSPAGRSTWRGRRLPWSYLYHEGVGVVSLSLLSFFSSTQVTLAGPQPGADRGDTPRAATFRARQQACLGIRDRGCILILIWQGELLGRPICTDPSSLAPRVVLLRAKGQLCALLSPLAGLLLCKGSRCCLFVFFFFKLLLILPRLLVLVPKFRPGWPCCRSAVAALGAVFPFRQSLHCIGASARALLRGRGKAGARVVHKSVCPHAVHF